VVQTLFQEAVRSASDRGEISELAAMLDMPGYRRQLLRQFHAWTSAERELDAPPPSTGIGDTEAWRLYNTYRESLAELRLVDMAGLAVWASRHLIQGRSRTLSRFRQITFLEFEPTSPAHWRVLEHAVQKVACVRATIPYESEPDRAEVFLSVVETRDRLLDLGFVEERVDCDLWRPAGLRGVESNLFRDAETSPSAIRSHSGLIVRGAPQGDGTARVLAREARRILEAGVHPSDLLILFRQWSSQADLILETLQAWGIPAQSQVRVPLNSDPAIAALRLAIRIPVDDWECDSLIRLLRHGQVRPSRPAFDPNTLAEAATAIKAARIFRGSPGEILGALARASNDRRLSSGRRKRAEAAREPVTWLLGLLEQSGRRMSWTRQVEFLFEIATALGLDRLPRSARSLSQLREILEERGDVVSRLRKGSLDRPRPWADFVRDVERAIDDHPRDESESSRVDRVRLALVDEVRGVRAKYVFLADLAEGTFPSREAVEPFLRVKPGEVPDRAASLGYSKEALRFIGVLGLAEQEVGLFYPTNDSKGQEILRAGFLDELLGLLSSEAENGCHEAYSRFHPALADRPELAVAPADDRVCAIARAREQGELSGISGIIRASSDRVPIEGVAAAIESMKRRGYHSPYGEFDGLLRDGAAILNVYDRFNPEFLFSPSQLETYLGCPFQFFAKYVMKLEVTDEREELGEDFTERGSRIHDLLEHLEGYRKDLGDDFVPAQIESIALNSVLGVEISEPTAVELGLREIENRKLGRVLDRYKVQHRKYEASSPTSPNPLAFELTFGRDADQNMESEAHPPLLIGGGDQAVRIQGMIDRIDIVDLPQGRAFRIIDYKSGKGPTASDVKTGRMLQLPLYAMAVQRHILNEDPRLLLDVGYWGLKKDGYRAIRFERWDDDQETLESFVIEIVRRMRQGMFPVNPRQQGCEGYCDFRAICRVRQVRSASKEPGDAFVSAIALSATASRAKSKGAQSSTVESPAPPGVVRARPLSADPSLDDPS
jgi:hypothetical protein